MEVERLWFVVTLKPDQFKDFGTPDDALKTLAKSVAAMDSDSKVIMDPTARLAYVFMRSNLRAVLTELAYVGYVSFVPKDVNRL